MPKKISIFGSTGSIGTQTLEVVNQYNDLFEIDTLTTNTQIDLLYDQILKFNPKLVIINDENSYIEFQKNYNVSCKIQTGRQSLIDYSKNITCDLLVSSLVGFAGVEPTLNAINCGVDVALANKETLVSAGSIITKAAKDKNVNIYAIDSEHNAILQCLIGEDSKYIEKLILTASGGPFRKVDIGDLQNVSLKDALNHPNWSMGSKITIDSATMMNKGLELIEAFWLFDINPSQLDVVIHPQSIIHSMVQFRDGSVKAQLGLPDMRVPISFALTYPKRYNLDVPRLDLTQISKLDFYKPDLKKFKCLQLAIEILQNSPEKAVILNAANEIAVMNFLKEKIKFIDIPIVIENLLDRINLNYHQNLENLIEIDNFTRIETQKFINNLK